MCEKLNYTLLAIEEYKQSNRTYLKVPEQVLYVASRLKRTQFPSVILKLSLIAPCVPVCFVFLLRFIVLGLSSQAENEFLPHWTEYGSCRSVSHLLPYIFWKVPKRLISSFSKYL